MHYIHRRVLRWCKGMMILLARVALPPCVWYDVRTCMYLFFSTLPARYRKLDLSSLHASDVCIFLTSGLIFAKETCTRRPI